ncbi:MAG: tRNA pseudouridine(38-40) synthase TruA [Clostridia bacterium]|nr:tRNA pseudouridine(38-40) synthase TruA [Clostridia bacterium]
MTFKLTMAYDGTNYHGWQRQKNGITVQEVLEDVLTEIAGESVVVTGCSRTDAGVHARIYVCSFTMQTTIPADKIPFVLNTKLPPDIRAYKCEVMHEGFNARFETVTKAYEYKIVNAPFQNPLMRNFAWHYPIKLDIDKMRNAAKIIQGKHDFASFCAAGSIVKSTVRNLTELTVTKDGDIITVRAAADGFLYNMVRIIVGTLVYVGCGKLSEDDIAELIKKKDRRLSGITAPPQGLALVEVNYE